MQETEVNLGLITLAGTSLARGTKRVRFCMKCFEVASLTKLDMQRTSDWKHGLTANACFALCCELQPHDLVNNSNKNKNKHKHKHKHKNSNNNNQQ